MYVYCLHEQEQHSIEINIAIKENHMELLVADVRSTLHTNVNSIPSEISNAPIKQNIIIQATTKSKGQRLSNANSYYETISTTTFV